MSIIKTLAPINPPAGVRQTPMPLHENLYWVNEIGWQAVVQKTERGIAGCLHVDVWRRTAGRPIELRGDDIAMSRADIRALLGWVAVPGLKLTLWWLGASYKVCFDTGEDGLRALETAPWYEFSDITDDVVHTRLVLRLLTLE